MEEIKRQVWKTLSILYFDGAVPSQPAKTKVIPGHLDSSLSLLRLSLQLFSLPLPLWDPPGVSWNCQVSWSELQASNKWDHGNKEIFKIVLPNGFINWRHRKTNLKWIKPREKTHFKWCFVFFWNLPDVRALWSKTNAVSVLQKEAQRSWCDVPRTKLPTTCVGKQSLLAHRARGYAS